MNDNLTKKYFAYQEAKCKGELDYYVNLLCDFSHDLDLLDIIHFLEIVMQYRNLKKFIENERDL